MPSTLTMQNNEFENNIAEIAGGALYTDPSSENNYSILYIENCIFRNNGYTTKNEANNQGCLDTSGNPIESIAVYNFTDLCPMKGGGALFLKVNLI